MTALEETKTGAGEKLTSSEAVEIETPERLDATALGVAGAATGLGAGLGAGFGAIFCRETGTPFLIGESKLTTLAGAGLGFGAGFDTGAFAAGGLTAGVLVTGALAAGSFVEVETARVAVTDFAQTVTEVAPVLDE